MIITILKVTQAKDHGDKLCKKHEDVINMRIDPPYGNKDF